MKKMYSEPDFELLKVFSVDIVTASNEVDDDTADDPFGPQN